MASKSLAEMFRQYKPQDVPRPVKTYHSQTYDRISPSKTKFDANGKTILITGGSTGIGFSIAQSFAEAGVTKIIIVARSTGPQAEAKEALNAKFPRTEVVCRAVSLTDDARMTEIFEANGPVDVLVLSAAASHTFGQRSIDQPADALDETIMTNVLGCWHVVRNYLRQSAPGSKTVINVSSVAAHAHLPRSTGYGPSKAAFANMLAILAAEHSPAIDGTRLFSYHPGALLTPLVSRAGLDEDSLPWDDIRLPGHFAVWLASPESDAFHGRFIWAHWDVDELIALRPRLEADPSFLTLCLRQ